MDKRFAILAGASAVLALAACACGVTEDPGFSAPSKPEVPVTTAVQTTAVQEVTTTAAVTTTAPVTTVPEDDGVRSGDVTVSESSDGIVLSFFGGRCKVTMPGKWKGHFIVDGNKVYSRQMYEEGGATEYEKGYLFEMSERSLLDKVRELETTEYTGQSFLVGSTEKGCVFYDTFPATEPPTAEGEPESYQEFCDMIWDMLVGGISLKFSCTTSEPGMEPLEMHGYVSPVDSTIMPGTWEIYDEANFGAQCGLYMIFTPNGEAVFQPPEIFPNMVVGEYVESSWRGMVTNANYMEDYDPPTQIAYVGGALHLIHVYSSAPVTASMTNVSGLCEGRSAMSVQQDWTLMYWNDSTYYDVEMY